jgi:hypothetical protein
MTSSATALGTRWQKRELLQTKTAENGGKRRKTAENGGNDENW